MFISSLILTSFAYQAPVKLEFMPPIGKTYHYTMTMNMSMAMPAMGGQPAKPMDMNMNTPMDMKVISRSGDVTTLETKAGSPKITGAMAAFMGAAAKASAGKTSTVQIDRHFGVKSLGLGGGTASSLFANISFPNHPLRVGESWNVSVDLGKVMGAMGGGASGAMGGGKLPLKLQFMGVQSMGGEKVALISVSSDSVVPISAGGQSMQLHLKMNGSNMIDVATGMVRSTKMVADVATSVQGHAFTQHMTQTLVRS